jgi:putative lipoic acid-binding regulatory protein
MSESILTFPCVFPIKIIGIFSHTLQTEISDIISQHCADFIPNTMLKMQPSKKGNYLALTATVIAQSQAQLDQLYLALTQHPPVKVVL